MLLYGTILLSNQTKHQNKKAYWQFNRLYTLDVVYFYITDESDRKKERDKMTDNELLLAISDIMDKKLKPVNDRLKKIELTQENEILPRLQNIESCYTSTSKRYQSGIEQIEAMQADIEVMKSVIREHSEKLQKLA